MVDPASEPQPAPTPAQGGHVVAATVALEQSQPLVVAEITRRHRSVTYGPTKRRGTNPELRFRPCGWLPITNASRSSPSQG